MKQMGTWGYKVDECDSFCEVVELYERKMQEGVQLDEIENCINDEYLISDNPDRHIAILALCYCKNKYNNAEKEWKKQIDFDELRDQDSRYWNELCNDPRMRNARRTALDAFINALINDTIKDNNSGPELYVHSKGDCFWYRMNGSVFGAIVLECAIDYYLYLIAVSERMNCTPKDVKEILESGLYTVAWFGMNEVLSEKRVHKIGKITLEKNYLWKYGLKKQPNGGFICNNIGQSFTWKHDFKSYSINGISIEDFLLKY